MRLCFPILENLLLLFVSSGINVRLVHTFGLRESARFTPSTLPLYPLDFQDNWQATEPIPVDINYSVPQFGPRDIENALKSHFKHSDTFFDKVRAENSTQERQKSIENEANSLLNSLRERIVYAHES